MLSNAYFVAKFRFDTAENEPAKNLQNFRKNAFSGEASSEWLQTRAANLQPAGSCKLSCSEKLAENARAFLVANRKAATASQLFFFIANAWETSYCSRGSTNVTCECSALVLLLHVQVVIDSET